MTLKAAQKISQGINQSLQNREGGGNTDVLGNSPVSPPLRMKGIFVVQTLLSNICLLPSPETPIAGVAGDSTQISE